MRKLVPGFDKIIPNEEKIEEYVERVMVVDGQSLIRREKQEQNGFTFSAHVGGGRVPAKHLSEGTLLALAILTLMHSPKRPRLVLLDDIDRALHPAAQIELVGLLRKLCGIERDMQIVATAHSDMIVASCGREEVVELSFDENGHTKAEIRDESPLLMTPSEIAASYFNISRTGASELLQRYALVANDPERTDAEDRQAKELLEQLRQMGADPGWLPVRRKRRR